MIKKINEKDLKKIFSKVLKINNDKISDKLFWRYSTQNLLGTGRYTSMAGAFGSLGGDFSGLSSNPAGIGMYQFSEFTFTPTLNLNSTNSYYNTSHIKSYQQGMSVGNLGFVFSMHKNNADWKRINIGIGWNLLANYDKNIKIEGTNYER